MSLSVSIVNRMQNLFVGPAGWIIQIERRRHGGYKARRVIGGAHFWMDGQGEPRAGLGGGVKYRLVKTETTGAKFSQWLCWGGANPLCTRIIWPSD